MMQKFWREWQRPLEITFLLLFVFFLPIREAPKNIFWGAYVATWIINRIRERDFGGPWNGWDTLSVLWVVAGYLSAFFPGVHHEHAGNEFLAVNDLVKYVGLLWCVRRAGYSERETVTVLLMLVFSCVLGEVEAAINLARGKRIYLELTSVGAVNHSAIYMAIVMGINAALLLAYWRTWSWTQRALLLVGVLALLAGLFVTGSRAAAGVAVVLVCVFAFLGARLANLGRIVWVGAAVLLVVATLVGGTKAVQRQVEYTGENYILTQRDLIWNRGLVAWHAHPWFGVGPDNYSQISENDLRNQLAVEGKPYVASDYARAPHAHSLYINQLVERGVVGFAALLAVLIAWAIALWRHRPRQGAQPYVLALWCCSMSGWLVTVLIGLVNTTLHHEHALLALMTLGLWLPVTGARAARSAPVVGAAALAAGR